MITNLKESECEILLANNYICQLCYIYNDRPYIVPMTYYFDKKNSLVICYSENGHKTKAMRKSNKVSIQVSEKDNNEDCNFVLAHGLYEEFYGSEAKKYLHEFYAGVKLLILNKEEKDSYCINDFSHKSNTQNTPIVFKITIDEITGKKINNR
jgi:nitroimidazol reductase NimA-like FMN-containing flavoprotein (pyridoxamine 5'-phosphate oxidase superfamily)